MPGWNGSGRIVKRVEVRDGLCYVPLSRGKVAICDGADISLVNGSNWCYTSDLRRRTGYAITNVLDNVPSKRRMHRVIMGVTDPKIEVDHIDGDGCNNRRANLRLCSKFQNAQNRKLNRSSLTGRKGVSYHRPLKKYRTQIQVGGVAKHVGYFTTKEEAARAYDEEAVRLHGEFAKTNRSLKF